MLTRKQRYCFFEAARAAASILGEDPEAYRHRATREETGYDSTKDLSSTGDFERCMVRFGLDAGNMDMAARYMAGGARRLGFMCEVCACQIAQITRHDPSGGIPYVIGILRQSGLQPYATPSKTWCLDVAERDLPTVFQVLDTHRRRLLHRAGWDVGIKFSLVSSYGHDAAGNVILLHTPPPPSIDLTIQAR